MKNSELKTFHITKLIFWMSLIGVVLAAGIYALTFHEINALGNETSVLRSQTNDLMAKESQAGELKKNLAVNQAKEPKLLSYFINANDIIPFLDTIEGYGRTTNVSVKFNSVDVKQSPDQLTATLKGDGSFANIYRFITLVESAPYELSITNASIQAVSVGQVDPKKAPAAPTWEANISISISSVTGAAQASAPIVK